MQLQFANWNFRNSIYGFKQAHVGIATDTGQAFSIGKIYCHPVSAAGIILSWNIYMLLLLLHSRRWVNVETGPNVRRTIIIVMFKSA